MKLCEFHMLLFYDLYFEFCSLNFSNIYYSTIHLHIRYDVIHTIFLFTPLAFLCSLLCPYKNEYIFDFNSTNSSLAATLVSFFIFLIIY